MTPAECIRLMFEKTDENGMLYIPAWSFDVDEDVDRNEYRIKMDWDKADLDRIIDDYDALYEDLEKIGEVLNDLDDAAEHNREVLKSEHLFKVWDTYLKPLDIGDLGDDIVESIWKAENEESYNEGTVTAEDRRLHDKYIQQFKDARHADAEHRVGSNVFSIDLVVRAMRLCKLFDLGAPECVIENEAKYLAQTLAIHDRGIEVEMLAKEEGDQS